MGCMYMEGEWIMKIEINKWNYWDVCMGIILWVLYILGLIILEIMYWMIKIMNESIIHVEYYNESII